MKTSGFIVLFVGTADDLLTFKIDNPALVPENSESNHWKVLVVDDEQDVHGITQLVLKLVSFKDRPIRVLDCYSAAEAYEALRNHPDIALILLDVVMESDDAGLRLVKTIRDDLQMKLVRIVLRTGQPGYAPEAEVVNTYDINDYQTKTDLTLNRLITVITANLRAYDSLLTIDRMKNELEQKVRERTAELETSNRLKDKLLSIVGHDLRGPIGNIRNFIELLEDSRIKQDRSNEKDYMHILQENSGAAMALLDNLFFWARSQQHSLEANILVRDLVPAVNDAIKLLSGMASNKQQQVLVDCPKSLACAFDEHMIALVIRNLLSNAIKFTPKKGQISLSLKDQGDLVAFAVHDSGVGMSGELRERLFSRHETVTTYGTNNEKGSGLGLALCQEFLAMHNTNLVVDSIQNQGTTMSFSLVKLPGSLS